MFNIPHAELETVRDELDQAIAFHNSWFDALNRTLVCGLPHEPADLADDADHRCRFGDWYYHRAGAAIHDHPAFAEIGRAHTMMHARATAVIRVADAGRTIGVREYDAFAHALQGLRLQLDSLRHEVEEAINNLDPLTGVYSRKSMLARLRSLWQMVRRDVTAVTLVMLDIDHFKAVNDRYGHLTGDRTLQAVARQILHWTRPYDVTFRYGGEEFLICLYDTDEPRAFEIAERIRLSLAEQSLTADNGEDIHLTASFGIAPLPAQGSVDDAIRHADAALYAAKNGGRNTTRFWREQSA